MTITPVGIDPVSSSASSVAQNAARATTEQVAVNFAPSSATATPLQQVGSSVVSQLKNFEASRADRTAAMSKIHAGPAHAIDSAKAELLSGPASQSLRPEGASNMAVDDGADSAITAMTRTFDYAIETQLIVKTGSQLSTSASSLMRGQ